MLADGVCRVVTPELTIPCPARSHIHLKNRCAAPRVGVGGGGNKGQHESLVPQASAEGSPGRATPGEVGGSAGKLGTQARLGARWHRFTELG